MSRPSQTESVCVQTVTDLMTKYLMSKDFRVFTRLSRINVQNLLRSPNMRGFMSKELCVHQTFVPSCLGFQFFTKLSCLHMILCVYVQTFLRSCPELHAQSQIISNSTQLTYLKLAQLIHFACNSPVFRWLAEFW